MFPSERQEQQVLRAATTGPSSIRLTWRNIQSSQGYRLEWREGEGQMSMLKFHIHICLLEPRGQYPYITKNLICNDMCKQMQTEAEKGIALSFTMMQITVVSNCFFFILITLVCVNTVIANRCGDCRKYTNTVGVVKINPLTLYRCSCLQEAVSRACPFLEARPAMS